MTAEPLLLGIDEGTTAVKAVVFDRNLQAVARSQRRVATAHPRPGWVEQDPGEVLDAVVGTVAEVLSNLPGRVLACGLDHQGESVLAWDSKTGSALSPIVVWQDKRSLEILATLTADGKEERIVALSGLPLDPYFSAGKLAWLLQQDSVRAANEAGTLRIGTVDAFLVDRLGGRFATDVSTGSRTQLCELGGRDWSDELLTSFAIPRRCLPAIGESFGALGQLSHPAWPQRLPLTAQLCDQQAALAGNGCVTAGAVKATYGTGVFVLANVGAQAPEHAAGLLPTVAWSGGGRLDFALDGGVFSAGSFLEWVSRELGIADSPKTLGKMAREVPDSGGVRILPALAGIGAPWWKNDARGVIAGIDGGTRPPHMARAALEAIAWRVADIAEAIRETIPLDRLRADGGLANESLLMQMQADAIGAAIEVGATDATVQGAAALAALGAGILDELSEIADLLPAVERFEPRRDRVWRASQHAEWTRFLHAAADLG